MAKSFFYRVFNKGKIPADLAGAVKSEGVLILDEGLKGSTTYLDFRAPGRACNWKRQWQPAAIVLTELRLLGLMWSRPVIDVPFSDERFGKLIFTLEDPERLCIAFDPGLFHDGWSGTIEYRFDFPQASQLLAQVRARTVRDAPLV